MDRMFTFDSNFTNMKYVWNQAILCIYLLLQGISNDHVNEIKHTRDDFWFINNKQQTQVPVLCYHNIRQSKKEISSDYTIDGDTFFKHIKMLSDSGYSAILPDELYEFMLKGEPLPPKSLMITSMRFNLDHQVKSWFKAGIAANALKSSRENITHFSSKILTA